MLAIVVEQLYQIVYQLFLCPFGSKLKGASQRLPDFKLRTSFNVHGFEVVVESLAHTPLIVKDANHPLTSMCSVKYREL